MSSIHVLLAGGLFLLAFPGTAYAYVDPGTAGLLLQGIIGGIVGALFVVRLYWQKLKGIFGFQEEAAEEAPSRGRTDD